MFSSLAYLHESSTDAAFDDFVKKQGTDVVIGANVGAYVGHTMSISSCTSTTVSDTTRSVGAQALFSEIIRSFSVSGTTAFSSVEVYSQTVSRTDSIVCGANPITYKRSYPSSTTSWDE